MGEIATTNAGSVAAAAVLAAFTAAVLVPSFNFVVWEPKVVWLELVAAPVGRGRDAAEMGMVLFGLTATTRAGSVAAAAVEAALTAAVFVPSLTLVVWLPRVVWFAEVAAPVGRGREAAETARVPVPALAVTVPLTGWVTAEPSTFHAVVFAVLPGCTVQVPPWFAVTVPETVVVPTGVAFTLKAVLSLAMATRTAPVFVPLPVAAATPATWARFTLWFAAMLTVPETGTGVARSWASVRPEVAGPVVADT